MPWGEVRLVPGINVQRTPTLLEAGYSVSQLIRFKDGLAQKYGGWTTFLGTTVTGVPRDLHAWQDLNGVDHLSIGTTKKLIVTAAPVSDITPQTLKSDGLSISAFVNSKAVLINDGNVTGITSYDSVLFNTPVSIGGIILSGLYPVDLNLGPGNYQITSATAATSTQTSSSSSVPLFTTASGSGIVSVKFANHGLAVGDTAVFPIATTANNVTILGSYQVVAVTDGSNYSISANTVANANGSFSMNGGNIEVIYYINLGPPAGGAGYGLGGYGLGGYGLGVGPATQTGTQITATDWTSDNWGEILLACPAGGGVYQYDPTGGFGNASLVSSAPPFNGGIFVSTSQEILICWASTVTEGIGIQQDPLLVKWSDVGDFTQFAPLVTNQAGDFRIPIGSMIVGGMAVAQQNLIWTDLDLWAMNYVGPQAVFGFNKIGAGAGSISSHAMMQLRGNAYWMGQTNFYAYTGSGVAVIPCPVWDVVFQNLNPAFAHNVRAMANTPFNEAGWFYPSFASVSGENDSYVKFNITEEGGPWDYGNIPRSAWIDQSVLGNPISGDPSGNVWRQETTTDAAGSPLIASFQTGYFYIAEGEDFSFVDVVIPDMKWGTFGGVQGAAVQISFFSVNYPGDTPRQYGPYVMTATTEYISTRIRGRQMAVLVQSADLGSFWRLGKIRYRYAPDGRR